MPDAELSEPRASKTSLHALNVHVVDAFNYIHNKFLSLSRRRHLRRYRRFITPHPTQMTQIPIYFSFSILATRNNLHVSGCSVGFVEGYNEDP